LTLLKTVGKKLNHLRLPLEDSNINYMHVVAFGGLVFYRKLLGNFVVCSPVTGSCTELPPLHFPSENHPLNLVVMSTTLRDQISYKIVLVFDELSNLLFKVYDSTSCWEDDIALRRQA